MKIEEAIVYLLATSQHGMKTEQIARSLNCAVWCSGDGAEFIGERYMAPGHSGVDGVHRSIGVAQVHIHRSGGIRNAVQVVWKGVLIQLGDNGASLSGTCPTRLLPVPLQIGSLIHIPFKSTKYKHFRREYFLVNLKKGL